MPPLSSSCSVASINTSAVHVHDLAPALPTRPPGNTADTVDLFTHRRRLIGNLARLVDDHLKDLDPGSVLARDVQALRDSDGRVPAGQLDFNAPLRDLIDVAGRAIACARQTLRLDEVVTFLLRQEARQPLPTSEQAIVSRELKHARTALASGDAEAADQSFDRIEHIRIQALGPDAEPLPELRQLPSTPVANSPPPIPPRRNRSVECMPALSVAPPTSRKFLASLRLSTVVPPPATTNDAKAPTSKSRAPRSDLVHAEVAGANGSMKQKILEGLSRIGQAVRSVPNSLRNLLSPASRQRARIDRAIDREIPLVPMREELKLLKADIHRAGVHRGELIAQSGQPEGQIMWARHTLGAFLQESRQALASADQEMATGRTPESSARRSIEQIRSKLTAFKKACDVASLPAPEFAFLSRPWLPTGV